MCILIFNNELKIGINRIVTFIVKVRSWEKMSFELSIGVLNCLMSLKLDSCALCFLCSLINVHTEKVKTWISLSFARVNSLRITKLQTSQNFMTKRQNKYQNLVKITHLHLTVLFMGFVWHSAIFMSHDGIFVELSPWKDFVGVNIGRIWRHDRQQFSWAETC